MFYGIEASFMSILLSAILMFADAVPMLKFLDAKTVSSSGSFVYEMSDAVAESEGVPVKKVEGSYLLKANLSDLEDPRVDLVLQANVDTASYYARLLVADKAVFTDLNTVMSLFKLAIQVIGDGASAVDDTANLNEISKKVQVLAKDSYQMVKIADLEDTDYQSVIEEFSKEQDAGKEYLMEMLSIFKDIFKGFTHDSIVKTENGVKVSLDREVSADLVEALYASYAANRDDVLPRLKKLENKIYAARGYTEVEQESLLCMEEPVDEAATIEAIVDELRNGEFEYFDDYKLNYEMAVQDETLDIKADILVTKGGLPTFTGKWEIKTIIREVEIKAPTQSMSLDEMFSLVDGGN